MGEDNSKETNKEKQTAIEKLTDKIRRVENEQAVLADKVTAREDPNEKPRTISKGFVKPGVKFQKNNLKISPVLEEN